MDNIKTKKEYYMEKLERFRLLDDDFMTEVFRDNLPAVELLLKIILGKDDIKVSYCETQRVMSGRGYRAIRMDVHAQDSMGRESDIEIQRNDRGAGARRARIHSAILDSSMVKPRQDFDNVADSFVIFITENDTFGDGSAIKSFTRRCDQNPGEQFGDGNYVIYVNGAYNNGEELIGKLMHDFRCVRAVDMYYPELAEKVKELKETEGGQYRMCKMMEDMQKEAKLEQAREIAYELHDMGLTAEKIAQVTKYSPDIILQWLEGRSSTEK